MWRNGRRRGFTLIEVTVVVAAIAVVLATALPHFIKMHMVGNEEAVIEAMRAVLLSCESYQANSQSGYPQSMAQLTLARPPYLDARFSQVAQGGWRGYRWFYRGVPGSRAVSTAVGLRSYPTAGSFMLTADPLFRGVTGQRSFYADQTGQIRYSAQGTAGPNSEVLERADK